MMIEFILFSLFWLTCIAAEGQFAKDPITIANTDFMQLSKKQKKAGWVCLASSPVLIAAAYFISEIAGEDYSAAYSSLAFSGLLSIPSGIHLLVLS